MDFEALVKHISTIQSTLQAQAAHAVNLALTARNWLMGCYIVEFEQNGEDRAAYGEQLLKKLEQRLNIKGLNERRFREFRRLYLVYPQLKEPIALYLIMKFGGWRPPNLLNTFNQLKTNGVPLRKSYLTVYLPLI